MEYLIQPLDTISSLDCNCYCKKNAGMTYNPCSSKCNSNCSSNCSTNTYCRTPQGPKLMPTGINPIS